jgi:hypothetical protein
MKVVIMGYMERGLVKAAWRRAIEFVAGRHGGIDRAIANRAGNPGRAGADILAYREDPSFAVAQRSGCIIRRSSAASNAPWPKARWRRSTIALAPAGNRRLRWRPRHGLWHWRAGRPRTSAIPTNFGRPRFLAGHAPRARTGRGTPHASPIWRRARLQDPRPGRW